MKANVDDYNHILENVADVEDFILDSLDQESKDHEDEDCGDGSHTVYSRCFQ